MPHSPLAMHMANELLNLPIAAITLIAGAAAVALAAARLRRSIDPQRLPLMGVMGAFVFAAQMINITLPGMPGTSGHLGGGVLLAILLGPAAGIVVMAAILIVQCLLFQDGGLLALGCNIINMGVVPCLAGFALYKVLLGRRGGAGASAGRQYLAAWLACIVGVTAGASLVPVQAAISGVLRVPVVDFLAVMIGVHLIIGLIEGAITFAVIAYLRSTRPAVVGLAEPQSRTRLSRPALLASFILTALLLSGVVAWFASEHPDGLEWSYKDRYDEGASAVAEPDKSIAAVDEWQARWSPLSDYTKRESPLGELPASEDNDDDIPTPEASAEIEQAGAYPAVDGWGSLAGIVGTLVTLGLLAAVSRLVGRRNRQPAAHCEHASQPH